ncbi:MAG: hypothetical protein M3016_07295 [Actinomycetota bacterium]|nr:hypothetical protein [Actinomycetota bacterium]
MSAPATDKAGLGARAVTAVAQLVGDRAIVIGSLPPSGRDLDLLVRRPERERLERALPNAGFTRSGSTFALFGACSAYAVELIDAERYLHPPALGELFAAALPLAGSEPLARPAPVHALLVLARLAGRGGYLPPKRRVRLERLLEEDPGAWEAAQAGAPAWEVAPALAALARTASGIGSEPAWRALQRRTLGTRAGAGLLVVLSGVDGAGKSSQARWLHEALTALGLDVDLVWNSLQGNAALDLVAKPAKALLRLSRRQVQAMGDYDNLPEAHTPQIQDPLRSAWSSYVTLANALEQRLHAARSLARGRVIIFDRGPLDLAVRMEVVYRSAVARQRRVVALATPRPDLAYLLDLPPEVSVARKDDIWSVAQLAEHAATYRALAPRFGARQIDATRAPDQIAAQIAREVWLRVAR